MLCGAQALVGTQQPLLSACSSEWPMADATSQPWVTGLPSLFPHLLACLVSWEDKATWVLVTPSPCSKQTTAQGARRHQPR